MNDTETAVEVTLKRYRVTLEKVIEVDAYNAADAVRSLTSGITPRVSSGDTVTKVEELVPQPPLVVLVENWDRS